MMHQLSEGLKWLVEEVHIIEQHRPQAAEPIIDFAQSLPAIVVSTAAWKLLFHYTGSMHLVATFHALAVAALALVNLRLGVDADFEHHLFTIMTGYFVADYFTYCIGHDPIVYGFHHVVTCLATYRMVNRDHWNTFQYASWCALLELSTPFLQHFRATKSPWSGALFVLSFFLLRVVLLSWLSYFALKNGLCINPLEKGIVFSFTLLNYAWFVQILAKARRESRKQKEEKKNE